ncbi:MAG TPA: alcohol dehydrogenase catalytic domain-containing protein [Bryobacteraceae bacterium]|nr:alcohol dehydrogenase catalytic domain-containing protein [Bryobacteraceae bacterium]
MIAIHLESGRVDVRDVPRPERPKGYALLRLIAAGICNTDLELQRGYYGFSGTPGHEFVAEVVESDEAELVGKRVVGEINLACHACDWCARGLERHCPTRTVLGIVRHPGAFSELFVLPDRNLHVAPDGMSNERVLFTEPVAAACEILDQVSIPPNEPVAVLGDGKLGLLISQVLHANGRRVRQFGRHAGKLQIAESRGIETEMAGQHLPRREYRWVVDATGSSAGLRQALSMVEPRGTVILKSTIHGEAPIDTARVIVDEITLVGSRCGRFAPALELLARQPESGGIDVESLIAERFALSQAPEALSKAAEPGVLKVILEA